jgi:hypothetical protein
MSLWPETGWFTRNRPLKHPSKWFATSAATRTSLPAPGRPGVAISNNRLISLDNGYVRFKYRDYRDEGRWKEAMLCAEEFIRRFLMICG